MKYYDNCHNIFFVVDVNLCVQYVNLVYYKPIFQFHSNLVHVIQNSSVYNFYEKYICALMVLFSLPGQCSQTACLNGGRCVDGNTQRCVCPSGFQGSRCQYGE